LIEVRVPKEIQDYEEKFFFNMTLRQLISVIVSCGITIPMYIFGKKIIPESYLNWLIIVTAMPIIMTGFFKYNGMHFEKYVKIIFSFNFNKQKRFKDDGVDDND